MDKQMSKIVKVLLVLILISILLELFPVIIKVVTLVVKFILPFVLGFTFAFLLVPTVDFLERHKFNRKTTSLFVVLLFISLIILCIVWISPILISEFKKLITNLPVYLNNIRNIIVNLNQKFNLNININDLSFDNIIEMFNKSGINVMNYVGKFIQLTFSYVVTIILTPILTLYFLIDYHKITKRVKEYLINHNKERYIDLLINLKNTMYSYFIGVFFVMLIMVVFSFLCFSLIKLDLAILWGIVIGITNIIPYVGPYIGGIIVGVFTLSASPNKFIYVVIIIIALQIIESNFITPLVERRTVKTHPILGIFFLSLFGELLGIFGMIIAIPCLSILQIILKYKKVK